MGILSIILIAYMWAEKDIPAIVFTAPTEQVIPTIATTIAVSLIKIAAIAGGILMIKWIIGKVKK